MSEATSATRQTREVLGIPIDLVDYDSAVDRLLHLIRLDQPVSATASNTHLIAHARTDASFAEVMRSMQLVLPDGMPLVWSLRAKGASLQDRVYGPYFMEKVIDRAPPTVRHFFFGGSQQCLEQLRERLLKRRPDLQIAGMVSPPFRPWTESDETQFIRQINDANPDIVWVALGGERQERWIHRNLERFQRGVFIGIGDAFELLAGRRPFAPAWLQKAGLTWAYRLWQEPTRLWKRYVKFNTLFLYFSLRDTLFPPALGLRRTKIAFLGSRGVPARYAGFETVVDHLGAHLVKAGYDVVVYNRPHLYPERFRFHRGMRLVYIPSLPFRALETISHTFFSLFHLVREWPQVVYLCGVGNAILAAPLRLFGCKIIANVDGTDFKRAKWSGFAQRWLQWSEWMIIRLAHAVIADNQTVVDHYREHYDYTPLHLAYGAEMPSERFDAGELRRLGLQPREYLLIVGRLSRENAVDLLLKAYAKSAIARPLVIVGGANYESDYYQELQKLALPGVIFAGPVYGDGYRELSQNCRFFILPAVIEATRLVLLDQLGFGNAVLYRDCQATREVVGDAAQAFGGRDESSDIADCAEKLKALDQDEPRLEDLREAAVQRIRDYYSWQAVTRAYVKLIEDEE